MSEPGNAEWTQAVQVGADGVVRMHYTIDDGGQSMVTTMDATTAADNSLQSLRSAVRIEVLNVLSGVLRDRNDTEVADIVVACAASLGMQVYRNGD
jgi:hypothetical protein